MNIVYILGNGFDKALNLPTSYPEFYKYYLEQASENEYVEKMKKHLHNHIYDTWADMEIGLGEYTAQVETRDELVFDYHSITNNLKAYLTSVNDSFNPDSQTASNFFNQFVDPWDYLLPGQRRDIISFVSSITGAHRFDILSLNYTFSFEKLVQALNGKQIMPFTYGGSNSVYSIRHIHQSLSDDEVIVGVNDISQIANEAFRDSFGQNLLVKPTINNQLRTLIDEECLSLIKGADLICIFGASLGETDLMWWDAIGKNLINRNSRLIYFAYENQPVTYNSDKIQKIESFTNLIMKRCKLDNSARQEEIRKRVFIGFKTKFLVFK